jgi:1A family penicillin-binding protein
MAYGPSGNGRNGHSNGVSRRPGQRSSRSDLWRDDLNALQQRARARTKRKRQPTGNGWRAAAVTLTVVTLGFFSLVLIGILVSVQAAASAYAAINRDLPSINQISSRETYKTAQVFDRNGKLLWEFYNQDAGRRTVVPINEISQYLIDATLAAEDPNFYSNPGIEPRGIVRAVYQNLSEQEIVSGASTITQQLVKRVLIPEEEQSQKSYTRKIKEALLAYQLTQKLSKGQILTLYLNEIFYGNQAYGIEAASEAYFGKHARELTLAEASMLAGLPQSPSIYDPLRNPVAAKGRQSYVLDQMVRNDFITQSEADAARQAELRYQPQKQPFLAPHWAMYIRSLIEEKYGARALYQGGYRIYTTLDYDLELKMEDVAKSNAANLAQRDGNNTAIVVMNPKTGEILSMVGSMDYWDAKIDGQVNVALSERQPGSTIKPLVYVTTFTKGWGPAQGILDEKISIPDELGRTWTPENFDLKWHGLVSVRSALGNSMNIPAVKAIQFAGVDAVADMARRFGITTWPDNRRLGLSMALGGAEVRPLDMTAAYTVLANNGVRIPPVAITKIVDADGNTVEEYKVPQGEQVVDPRFAYMISNILSDNNARLITYGPDSLLKMPRPAAAKTGTTDSYRDTWTMGYTPNLTVGVWVGNSDGHPMKEVLSSMSAGKIWRDAMDTAIDYLQLPVEEFQRPGGLVDAQVCGDAGIPGCRSDLFPVERAPTSPRVNVSANGVIPATGPAPTPGPAAPPATVAPAPAVAPTTGPADAAPANQTTAPGAPEGQPNRPAQDAQPAPTAPPDRPAILPSGPIIAPQRPQGPPPQATPAPKPQQPAPQPTAAPAAKPQQPQPTAAPKPQQNQVQPTTRNGAQPTPKPR